KHLQKAYLRLSAEAKPEVTSGKPASATPSTSSPASPPPPSCVAAPQSTPGAVLEFSAEVGAGASNVWVPLPLRGTGVLLLRGEPRYSSRDTGSHQEIRDSARTPLQARRSKSKSYGQSVSSLTPEEWRVRLESLGDSASRRTLATRDGSKSEVDAPCLCVWETQSRT
ncbi:MAG: hypothetical protein ACPIOQ_20375, partial [Promethearchaeia archaeon]